MITLSNIGWQSGLRDWFLQRFTGIYIGLYCLFILYYFFITNELSYINLSLLFSSFLFKIITVVFVFSLTLHSSLGLSIILNDYIKKAYLRIILDCFVNIMLLSYIFCIMQILWGF